MHLETRDAFSRVSSPHLSFLVSHLPLSLNKMETKEIELIIIHFGYAQ